MKGKRLEKMHHADHADVSHNAIRAFFSSQETGALNVEGKAAYSMTEDQIGSSLSDVSGSALLLAAGTTVAGTIKRKR